MLKPFSVLREWFVTIKTMNETVLAAIGIAAGIINLSASIPYFIDIFRGSTRPERATWWMWFALGSVGLGGQIAGGARWSLVLATTSVLVAGATAVLSVKYGYGKFHQRDRVALSVTAIGIVLSLVYRNPLIVISTIFIIDSIAGGLTIYKTWYAPLTESIVAWSISTVGVTLGLLAVGDYRPAIFLLPLSNFLVNASMIGVIIFRRNKVKKQPQDVVGLKPVS